MKTMLSPGSYVKFKYKGDFDYAHIEADGTSYTVLPREAIPLGALVHKCVWKKGEVLEPRGKAETITEVDARFQAAFNTFIHAPIADRFKVMDKILCSISKWLCHGNLTFNFRHQQVRDALVAWHEGKL